MRAALWIVLALLVSPTPRAAWNLEPFAGGGPDGIPAVEANLNTPISVVLGAAGELYVVTYGDDRVYRIDPSGGIEVAVESVFTNEQEGILRNPTDIALGPDGDLFITEPLDRRIVRVDLQSGAWSAIDVSPVQPDRLAVDDAGNIFFSTVGPIGSVVRRIDAGIGSVDVVAGCTGNPCSFDAEDAPAVEVYLTYVSDVVIDSAGNLFLAERGRSRVRRVDGSTGLVRTYAGNGSAGYSGDGGAAVDAQLDSPMGLALDVGGNIFVADTENQRLRRVDALTGMISTVAGSGTSGFSGDGGPALLAALNSPQSVAVNPAGDLVLADVWNMRVRGVDAATGLIRTIGGNGTLNFSGDGYLATQGSIGMSRIALDSAGNAFIADGVNNRVRRVDAVTRVMTTVAGNGGTDPADYADGDPAIAVSLPAPMEVAIDSAGNLLIASEFRVHRVDAANGTIRVVAGGGTGGLGGPATDAALSSVRSIALDSADNLYISTRESVLKVEATTGTILLYAGGGGSSTDEGVLATEAILQETIGLSVGPLDGLLISDSSTRRLRRIDPQTERISTIAGALGLSTSCRGGVCDPAPPTGVNLFPNDATADRWGNVFVSTSSLVYRVDGATGLMTTILGQGLGEFPDRERLHARGIEMDSTGSLLISSGRRIVRAISDNHPPVAVVDDDISVLCESSQGARVLLDGSGSYDPDQLPQDPDRIRHYWWYLDFGQPAERILAKGAVVETTVPVGVHQVTLLVIDDAGERASATFQVAVQDDVDPDGDSVGSCRDTCSELHDPDQADGDGNGLGDVCDPCWAGPFDDPDGDGVCSDVDNCAETPNPDQHDGDGDLVGDPCDICPANPNPEQLEGGLCVDVVPRGEVCLAANVDLLGETRSGRILLSRIDRFAPDLHFNVSYRACSAGDTLEFYVNETLLRTEPVPFGCTCGFGGPAGRVEVDVDAAEVASAWRFDGDNTVRLVKNGSASHVLNARLEYTLEEETRSRTLFFSGVNCNLAQPQQPFEATLILDEQASESTEVFASQYVDDRPSVAIDLTGLDDGEYRLCIAATHVSGAARLYGVTERAELFSVDPFTGAASQVGVSAIRSEEIEYDHLTGRAYGHAADGFGRFFDIRDGTSVGPLSASEGPLLGLEYVDGTLYAVKNIPGGFQGQPRAVLLTLDPDTGSQFGGYHAGPAAMSGLAYDPFGAALYGLSVGLSFNASLVAVDLSNGDATPLADRSTRMRGLEHGPDGTLYSVGLDDQDGLLYRLDPVNGDVTAVGETGFGDVNSLTLVGPPGSVDCTSFSKQGEALLAVDSSCGSPTAVALAVSVVECDSSLGAVVSLDGSGSSDPNSTPGTDDSIVAYDWFDDFGGPAERLLGSGRMLSVALSVGLHEVTLRVTNRFGETATDEREVLVTDNVAPTLSVSLSPATLWPPNHRLVDVDAILAAADNCGAPEVVLESVSSSEADDLPGGADGKTTDDIQDAEVGSADTSLRLRAERSGSGTGRFYTVRYVATDRGGNATSATAVVSVPHDQGTSVEPVELALRQSAAGTLVEWSSVPGALYYNVVRGELDAVRETQSAYLLGQMDCVLSASSAVSTAGREDTVDPTPGSAFIYLVEYNDGWTSSYGSESVAKPRVAAATTCP